MIRFLLSNRASRRGPSARLCFCLTAFAAWFVALPVVLAGVLATQSNPVSGEFSATENWTNAANWNALPRYPADPTGDGSPLDGFDWGYTQVAHNNDYFFIRYHNSHPFAGDRQLMYFDTDSDRATGLPGFTGNVAVGAEYYLSGAGLNNGNTVSFMDFVGWNNQQDGEGQWDIVIAIDRSGVPAASMPGVTSFNFVNQNHDQGGDDWYPDAGNSGAEGDYFRYEATQPTVNAFGRTWNVFEPVHRDNPAISADVTGAANSLSLTGVFGTTGPLWDTRALTPLTVQVGTKVSYDFAITNEQRDPIGDGLDNWIGDAFGAFTVSDTDPANANIVSVRTGVAGGDNPPGRIQYNDIALGELGFASLAGFPLNTGVHIEWLFTSDTTAEVSVYSPDSSTLLGTTYVDEIEQGIASIQGFRFNLFDSEQTMTVTNFTVESSLPGDFNSDGHVDGLDLTDPTVGWKARFGVDLDGHDFLVWQQNVGAGVAAAATSVVPEPTASWLALWVASSCLIARNCNACRS
jgi:hypothetical protein